MITWTAHPFLPHDEGRIGDAIIVRRAKACDGSVWMKLTWVGRNAVEYAEQFEIDAAPMEGGR